MTLTTSMFIGLIVVLIPFAIGAMLYGAVVLLADHPVLLAIAFFLFCWVLATFLVYVRG